MNFLIAGGTTAAYMYSVVLVVLAISTKEVPFCSASMMPLTEFWCGARATLTVVTLS